MNRIRLFLEKWFSDYDFKTFAAAGGSLLVTVFFAFYNGYLGIHYESMWYGTICAYYIILALLRFMVVLAERRLNGRPDAECARARIFAAASVLLLILNISLVIPVSLMATQQKPVHMTLVPAITMAAYTTYKITMASINLKRRERSSNCLTKPLRAVSFVDALVSVLTLQNTLIAVNSADGGTERPMLILSAVTSAVIFLMIMILTIATLIQSVQSIKSDKKHKGEQQ